MVRTSVSFMWRDFASIRRFSTGVCLHGHTMHSEECLNFLPRYLRAIPGISQILEGYERGRPVDFNRSWWTPPLSPASALRLEQNQEFTDALKEETIARNRRLPDFKRVGGYLLSTKDFPRTASMKIKRADLAEDIRKTLGRAAVVEL